MTQICEQCKIWKKHNLQLQEHIDFCSEFGWKPTRADYIKIKAELKKCKATIKFLAKLSDVNSPNDDMILIHYTARNAL